MQFYKILTCILLALCTQSHGLFAQDASALLREAISLDKQLKEPEALDKYKQVLAADASNINALLRCTELNAAIGARQKDKNAKLTYYTAAQTYAQQAIAANPDNADANYAMAVAAGKLTEVEEDNKKLVEYVRQSKLYADKALTINAGHAKANYTLGKWHFEMVNLNWVKKAAVKTLYGGLPKSEIDSAIFYMEKCRALDQYFVVNMLDLAKVYQYNHQPTKAIEMLNKLIKLPNRTFDDAARKEEGKKMLDELK
jgi:hypothetical protein